MSEIVKCKDCKWWLDNGICKCSFYRSAYPFDLKDRAVKQFLNGNCIAIAPCDSTSILYTGANFGCVHGEKKK